MIPLRDVLEAYERRQDGSNETRFADEILVARGHHPKAVGRKLEAVQRAGYIDSGVTTRSGWLTEKGKAKLAELRSEYAVKP